MQKPFRMAVAAAAIGITALSLSHPAQAGYRSAVGAGLVGFGIGAMLGSMMGPPEVYFVPTPPPDYYGPPVYGPRYYGRFYEGPVAYGSPRGAPDWHGNRAYQRQRTPAPHAAAPASKSPQARPTTTAKAGAPTTPVKPDPLAKFKAAQAKAKRDGVATLTQKDIEGLTPEQIKQLRGY